MHVPDGFIDAPVSVAAGAVAAAAVAVSLRGARHELASGPGSQSGPERPAGRSALSDRAGPAGAGERAAPLAGLVAAFIFAVQMLNFPIGAGTSGHLLGGALAAVLVGPYTAVLCVSVVLLLQAVLFADGGLTALGVNITVMGVVTVLVAYGVFRALLRLLPRRRSAVTGAAFVAALVSVPAAAVAFTGLYALGGTTDVALGKVFAAMVGVHVLIGIGEAVITAATVGAVAAVRPDLVYAARDRLAVRLELRTPPSSAPGEAPALLPGNAPASGDAPAHDPQDAATGRRRGPRPSARTPSAAPPVRHRSTRPLWIGGVLVTLLCAGGLSFYASASPDGLEKVASDNGIDEKERAHSAGGSPLADYGVRDIPDARLSGGLAGVIGAGATLAVGSGVFVVLRRRRAHAQENARDGALPGSGTGPWNPAPEPPSGAER